jgi:hypothetical protein
VRRRLANGNYHVAVELGSATNASSSRVQAELYRIVTPVLNLAAGAYSQQTFSVNVRAEDHDGYDAAGNELNILIDGDAPALSGLGYVAADIPSLRVEVLSSRQGTTSSFSSATTIKNLRAASTATKRT